jgi:hypothetical protein
MFRFSSLLVLILSIPWICNAQENRLLSFSYYNWAERMTISDGAGNSVEAPSNLAAVGVQFDYLASLKNSGWLYSVALLTGSGTGGLSSSYLASYQPFFGLMGSAAYFFKVEKRVYLELGPLFLYRSLKWPEAAGNAAVSGSDANFGMTANLRVRLFKNLDYCQSIGTLLTKATTIWSLGFGYRF